MAVNRVKEKVGPDLGTHDPDFRVVEPKADSALDYSRYHMSTPALDFNEYKDTNVRGKTCRRYGR